MKYKHMISSTKTLSFFLFVFSLACTGISSAREIQLQLYVWPRTGLLSRDSNVEHIPNIVLKQGSNEIPFRAARGSMGPVVTVPHTGRFEFHRRDTVRSEENTAAEAETTTVPYFDAAVPASWNRAVIVLFPERRAGGGKIESSVLNFDPQRLRVGVGTFFNGTDTPLQMVIQGQVHALAPYSTLTIPRRQLQERLVNGNARFSPQLFYQDEEGRWRQSYNGIQYVRPDSVNLFWIHSSGAGRSHRIRPLRTAMDGE
ncbi:MAG: hypothetical protein JJU05_13375 [Verrucomicrobia bacterium]|nr:hypothetical protein [Verrucomicrobiota bacterium]MCH8527971.1 hypothetical protein [Kiritimatiellia bacterium]